MPARLRAAGLTTAVLSNGSPRMLWDGLRASGLASLVDRCFSVDGLGFCKPDPRVYRWARDWLGLACQAVSFRSSNAWDAAGAAAFGLPVVWLNRGGRSSEHRFVPPALELPDLSGFPDVLAGQRGTGDRPAP